MNKLSIVMVCAGVFCTTALSSVHGATCPVAAADEQTIVNGLKNWINGCSGAGHPLGSPTNWAQQIRGNNTPAQPDFGTHLQRRHESQDSTAPTLNKKTAGTNTKYDVGTQFLLGNGLGAVDAFLNEVNAGRVNFTAKKEGNTWHVTATLKKDRGSLPYLIYDPVPSVKVRSEQDFTVTGAAQAKDCIPGWKCEVFCSLGFDFHIDNANVNQYKLTTIYPVCNDGTLTFCSQYIPAPVLIATWPAYYKADFESWAGNNLPVNRGKKTILADF